MSNINIRKVKDPVTKEEFFPQTCIEAVVDENGDALGIDASPTEDSDKLVRSGGVKAAIDNEAAARTEAVSGEASLRADAVSNEASAREAADASLSIGVQAALAAVSAEQQRAVQVENTKYSKPAGGIPKVDLASDVRNALDLATDVVYDISAHNNNTAYADLAAALGNGGANVPQSLRKGGMSVRFVLSSDNKYVQSRYMGTSIANADFTNVANWQGVDVEPAAKSKNLVESGGVEEQITLLPGTTHNTDLDFSDTNDNVLVRFSNGHIKTKNFDSSKNSVSEAEVAKLGTVEAGAQVNDVETENTEDTSDLNIMDDNDNILIQAKNGHIRTKNFDSSSIKENNLSEEFIETVIQQTNSNSFVADLEISDEASNIILQLYDGNLRTKNFDSVKTIEQLRQNLITLIENSSVKLEDWSRFLALDSTPLQKIRFDTGMCGIFKKWGFIGDSLSSGEVYGYNTSLVTLSELTTYENKALSINGLVDDETSVVKEYTYTGYFPGFMLLFQNNTGLNGKVLSIIKSDNTIIINGSQEVRYTYNYGREGLTVYISYPKTNVPSLYYSNTVATDKYEFSWGQQICRLLGVDGYNFSKGGQTAKGWCSGNTERTWGGAQESENFKDVYTIALGVNEIYSGARCIALKPNDELTLDDMTETNIMADIDLSDYAQNADTFAGWYAGVIQRLKSVNPYCYIFTITTYENSDLGKCFNKVIQVVTESLNAYYRVNTVWLLDVNSNFPKPADRYVSPPGGHWTVFGYLFYAYVILNYIDWIIRNNITDFQEVAWIGSQTTTNRYDITKLINI